MAAGHFTTVHAQYARQPDDHRQGHDDQSTYSGITGTSNTITTRGLTVTSLTPTPSGFVATFNKPFNPGRQPLRRERHQWSR